MIPCVTPLCNVRNQRERDFLIVLQPQVAFIYLNSLQSLTEMSDCFFSNIDPNMVFAYCKTYDISSLFPCWHTPRNLFLCFRYGIMDGVFEADEVRLNSSILSPNIFVNGSRSFAAIVVLTCSFEFSSTLWTYPHWCFSFVKSRFTRSKLYYILSTISRQNNRSIS